MGHKGHWGEYTGNAKWSKDHAHTKVTKGNYKASERDDAAHIDYLKRDIKDDQKFHVKDKDEKQTADEKHISKLAGDMKYDKEHHGSPAAYGDGLKKRIARKQEQVDAAKASFGTDNVDKSFDRKLKSLKRKLKRADKRGINIESYDTRDASGVGITKSPVKHNSASGRSHIHSKYHTSYEGDATFPKDKKKGGPVVKGDHGPSRFKKQKQEAEANKENKEK